MSLFARRRVLSGALAAGAITFMPAGPLSSSMSPTSPAAAQSVAEIIDYALTGRPLTAFVAFMERIGSSESKEKRIDVIAAQVESVARNQEEILRQLADIRIVLREEVERGFRNNDIRELTALVGVFRIALSNIGGRQQKLQNLADQVDKLTLKIATHGLPAVPAYISAITLQNSLHHLLGASPETMRVINEMHGRNL